MIISKLDFLTHTQLDEETLDIWIAEEWLIPSQDLSREEFTEADVARAKLISDLIHDLGVNQQGVGIILDLLDQVHSLRKAMAERLSRTK
jgi:chaperone modulatory protein CbpM